MQRAAIIFGATGLIGGYLLQLLLEHPDYDMVTTVVRQPLEWTHPKLITLTADLQSLDNIKEQLVADDVFCCLGTTRRKTPDLNDYYKIDHDYPVAAATLTKANGAEKFLLVSAVGANAGSSNFYLRMKGETERDVQAVDFEQLHLFRPSLLTGQRNERRGLETLSSVLFKAANPLLIGKWKRYRSIPAADVAKAMKAAAQSRIKGTRIYYWSDMKGLA